MLWQVIQQPVDTRAQTFLFLFSEGFSTWDSNNKVPETYMMKCSLKKIKVQIMSLLKQSKKLLLPFQAHINLHFTLQEAELKPTDLTSVTYTSVS